MLVGNTHSKGRMPPFSIGIASQKSNLKEHLKFAIVSTHIDQEEWKEVDNGNNNYYATVIRSEDILEKDHKMLVGKRLGRNIILEEIDSR